MDRCGVHKENPDRNYYGNPDVRVKGHLEMSSIENILGMKKRQSMQKVAHRSSARWITQGELHGVSGGQDELSDTVFGRGQRILSVEQMRADNMLHPQ